MKQPEVSVILATYNRCEVLRGALESLMNQERGADYEIILVDNNSTDETRSMVEAMRKKSGYENLSYCFEAAQGVAYARNKGISEARGSIIAFTDDDIRPSPNWVLSISEGFKKFPEADCIGGKVLPAAGTKFPEWLTKQHWAPLALLDLGDRPMQLDVYTGAGLVAANLAVRASVFADVGLFIPQFQRVKNSIGSLEDHEFQLRLRAADKRLMYLPDVVTYAHVLEERLSKSYHRRWHFGHGHFYALMRDQQFELSKFRLFDVPGHLYRRAYSNALSWLSGNLDFERELEIQFFWGFFRQRFADRRAPLRQGESISNKGSYAPH